MFSRAITIDHTQCGSADSAQFPAVIAGVYAFLATTANGGKVQSASGFDIVAYADAGLTQLLPFERVSWNAVTGAIELWVRVATLSASANTTFWLGYGSTSITTDQSNTTGVWSNGFARVFHLGDDPGATAPQFKDSVSNSNFLSLSGGASANAARVAGICGNGVSLVRTSEYSFCYLAQTVGSVSGQGTGSQTTSGWFYRTNENNSGDDNSHAIVGRQSGSYPNSWFTINLNKNESVSFTLGSEGQVSSGSTALSANTWNHLAIAYDGSSALCILYVNGSSAVTVTRSQGSMVDGLFQVGGQDSGYYDEVQASSVLRSASWITAGYNNTKSPAGFYSVGSEVSPGGANYTQTVIETLTIGSSLGRSLLRGLGDSATVTSTLARSLLPGPRFDLLVPVSSLSRLAGRAFYETDVPVERLAKGVNRVRGEVLGPVDSGLVRSIGRSSAELLVLADSAGRGLSRAVLETIASAEGLSRSAGARRLDAVSTSDSGSRSLLRGLAETLGFSEVLAVRRAKLLQLLDVVGLSDALLVSRTKLLQLLDSLLAGDAVGRSVWSGRSDLVNASDSASRSLSRGLAETLGFSEFLAVRQAKVLQLLDSVGVSDALVLSRTKLLQLLDWLLAGDAVGRRSVSRGLADHTVGSESVGRGVSKGAGDNVAPFDGLGRWLFRTAADWVALGDLLALVKAQALALVDWILSAETLGRRSSRVLTDTVGTRDALGRILSKLVTLLDLVLPVDSIGRGASRLWSELAAVLDWAGAGLVRAGVPKVFAVRAAVRHWPVLAMARAFQVTAAARVFSVSEAIVITTNKDPGATEDFQLDWTAEVGSTDSILTSAWTVPAPLVLVRSSFTGHLATARLAGGVADKSYVVTNIVTLQSGQIKARNLHLAIEPA